MEEAKLPPLPQPAIMGLDDLEAELGAGGFTGDQMQAYGAECARLELERFIAMLRECPDTVYRDLTIEAIREPKS